MHGHEGDEAETSEAAAAGYEFKLMSATAMLVMCKILLLPAETEKNAVR